MRSITYIFIFAALLVTTASCKKYLDAKPDIRLKTATTLESLQGILDYYPIMNQAGSEATETASDNYYLDDPTFDGLPGDNDRNAYLWKPHMFLGGSDWTAEYNVVYNANLVLENIASISRNTSNATDWDKVKGSAFFFRGKAFYEIAQIWTKAFDSSSANTDPGIPLRLSSDFNSNSVRANLSDTYKQIIADLQSSIPLLPESVSHPYRPSKPGAYGFLAKTYLAMQNYTLAGLYADSCLKINNKLLDFNGLDTLQYLPFQAIRFLNPEDIFHSSCQATNSTLAYNMTDTLLYKSYDQNDLRKLLYFAPWYTPNPDSIYFYQGSYDVAGEYNGIATDEMYLIRAECAARAGNIVTAMNDLNSLLIKRWKTGTFIPLTASSGTEALNKILMARRKELVFRMCRFTDIKRLNKEGAAISVQRVVHGTTYTLGPNDPRDALPIPELVIQFTGMPQN